MKKDTLPVQYVTTSKPSDDGKHGNSANVFSMSYMCVNGKNVFDSGLADNVSAVKNVCLNCWENAVFKKVISNYHCPSLSINNISKT